MRPRSVFLPAAGLGIAALAFSVYVFKPAPAGEASSVSPAAPPPLVGETMSPAASGAQTARDWNRLIDSGQAAATLAKIERENDPALRARLRREFLASWARADLAELAAWFDARNSADELHQDALQAMVAALLTQGGDLGFKLLEKSLPPKVRDEVYGPFFRQWASTDPAAAANALIARNKPAAEAAMWSDLIGQVVARWSHVDLDRAVAWTTSLPEGAEKTRALVQLGYQWTERAPAAAAAYALGRKDPALLGIVAGKWAESDPRAALAWAAGIPAGESRNQALTGAATAWAQKDPAAAAGSVDGLAASAGGSQATLAVVSAWALADPAQAALWVTRFPEGALREAALAQLVGSWAANSTETVGRWIERLPATRSRDVAIGAFCGVLMPKDPARAFEWARRMSDETLRTQTMENAAIAWDDRRIQAAL